MLICLRAMSIPGFPPPISHQLFLCPKAVMTSNIRWCCPCIIGVCHHGLRALYISMGNYRLGLFSPDTQQQRVWGQTWIEGIVISKFGKWAPWHSSPRFSLTLDAILWTTSVEYYFCVSCKPQPVRMQAASSFISYYMHIGIKGTTPGVEWGKELSLSAEERSSPESHSLRADADGLRPVTYNWPQRIRTGDLFSYVALVLATAIEFFWNSSWAGKFA